MVGAWHELILEKYMKLLIEPIGTVHSERSEAVDDHWKSVRSWIELIDELPEESLYGLGDFSHVEIIYYFHKVDKKKIIVASEHPREDPKWPKVGIFAQRKRARPNLLGATIARIEGIERKRIYLSYFDAIEGTPVIDIKPIFKEYLPLEEIIQPEWVSEVMKEYW
jgi:tRNA-Thr(GGU) m(6)t(6)A37 methyltransferase TsaA